MAEVDANGLTNLAGIIRGTRERVSNSCFHVPLIAKDMQAEQATSSNEHVHTDVLCRVAASACRCGGFVKRRLLIPQWKRFTSAFIPRRTGETLARADELLPAGRLLE
jgi:hypothetical protein